MHAKPPRPVPLQGDLRNLAVALDPLKALPNWVCWKFAWRVDKKGAGKWTKPPYQPKHPGQRAKNNDPSTWGTYEEALVAFEAGKCDGIGFCLFGTWFACFDLDAARDPATGEIAPEAMAYVHRAASYSEVSVSGTGVHVIGFGFGPKVHRKQKIPGSVAEIESYRGCARYIVVTANPLPGSVDTWPHLINIDAEIDAVVSGFSGQHDGSKDDPGLAAGDVENAALPGDLIKLIENGVSPQDDLSAAFHHAVCWLHDCGWTLERIEAGIASKPIVPARYAKRLGQEIARCLQKVKNNPGNPSGSRPTAPANSEEFLALIFIDRHEADLRFVAKWGQWFHWDDLHWQLEETLHAFDMARVICREAANVCNKSSTAKTLASAKTVAAVERLAKADRKLAATFEQWDTDLNKITTSEED
jgi:D5 N terminal like